jgi:hypothetical protein
MAAHTNNPVDPAHDAWNADDADDLSPSFAVASAEAIQAAAAFFNEAEDSQTTIGLSVARTRRGETNEEAITRVTAVRAEIRKQVR